MSPWAGYRLGPDASDTASIGIDGVTLGEDGLVTSGARDSSKAPQIEWIDLRAPGPALSTLRLVSLLLGVELDPVPFRGWPAKRSIYTAPYQVPAASDSRSAWSFSVAALPMRVVNTPA
jgi:hypothetical protein